MALILKVLLSTSLSVEHTQHFTYALQLDVSQERSFPSFLAALGSDTCRELWSPVAWAQISSAFCCS